MRGFYAANEGHFVNALPPVDITGGVESDFFSMANYSHATIVVAIGVSAAAFTKIIVNASSDNGGTGKEAIPFTLYSEETAAGDTLGAAEAVAVAGKTPTANDNVFYVIELDDAELPDGKPWVSVELTNGANSVIASILAILSGSRFAEDQSATVLA